MTKMSHSPQPAPALWWSSHRRPSGQQWHTPWAIKETHLDVIFQTAPWRRDEEAGEAEAHTCVSSWPPCYQVWRTRSCCRSVWRLSCTVPRWTLEQSRRQQGCYWADKSKFMTTFGVWSRKPDDSVIVLHNNSNEGKLMKMYLYLDSWVFIFTQRALHKEQQLGSGFLCSCSNPYVFKL